MFRKRAILLAIGLAIIASAPALVSLAQATRDPRRPKGSPEGGNDARRVSDRGDGKKGQRIRRVIPDPLILSSAVQEELKLTAEQRTKVRELDEAVAQTQTRSIREAVNPEAALDVQALMTMISDQRNEKEAALARILTSRQRARLAQIALQLDGPAALTKPEVANQLNLSPEQVELIQMTLSELGKRQVQLVAAQVERSRARQPGGQLKPDHNEVVAQKDQMGKAADRIQAEALRQINRILTRRQQLNFKKLLGEPFDLSRFEAASDRSSTATPSRTDRPSTQSVNPPTDARSTICDGR
jgi:Spy/CpxP family protein refolding chaperone